MYGSLALIASISFITTFFLIPKTIALLSRSGILGIDQQKKDKPRVPTSGGIVVGGGFIAGMMVYIAANTFLLKADINVTFLLAATCSVLIGAMIGLLDDLHVISKPRANAEGVIEYRVGLKQWQKPILSILAAVPLMAVRAGQTSLTLPFIGSINFGIWFPLLLIPVAVICVTNAYNMLAGMNGLESGLGFVSFLALGIFIFLRGQIEGALIAFAAAFSLLAFLKFNSYPARILPGDSLTYFAGAAFVAAAIIGNVEKFAIIIFLPWIIEAFLKLFSRFKASSLGILQPDGTLTPGNGSIRSLTHLVMRSGRFTEKQVTAILIGFEIVVCIAAYLLVVAGII